LIRVIRIRNPILLRELRRVAALGNHEGKVGAFAERRIFDARHRGRYRDGFQAFAIIKRSIADGRDAFGEDDAREAGTVAEHALADRSDAVRDNNTAQAAATVEHTIAY